MAAEPPAETGGNGVIASFVGGPLEDRPWPHRAVHRRSRRARLRQRRRGRAVGTARQRRRRPSRAGRLADPPSAPTRPRPATGLLRRSTRDRARTLGPGPPGRGGGLEEQLRTRTETEHATDLATPAGLMRGAFGPALFMTAMFEASGDESSLDAAADALRLDLLRCVPDAQEVMPLNRNRRQHESDRRARRRRPCGRPPRGNRDRPCHRSHRPGRLVPPGTGP